MAIISACGNGSSSFFHNINEGGVAQTSNYKLYYPDIKSATVCIDSNNNNFPDDNEQCVDVGQNGEVHFDVYNSSKPLVAVILASGTEKTGNAYLKTFDNSIKNILVSPAGMNSISIYTTLIKSELDNNPQLTLSEAENIIKKNLNINSNINLDEITQSDVIFQKLSKKSEELFNEILSSASQSGKKLNSSIIEGILKITRNMAQKIENLDKNIKDIITKDEIDSIISSGSENNIEIKIKQLSLGDDDFNFYIDSEGSLYAWGNNNVDLLGLGNNIAITPLKVSGIENKIVKIIPDGFRTYALTEAGTIYMWGSQHKRLLPFPTKIINY